MWDRKAVKVWNLGASIASARSSMGFEDWVKDRLESQLTTVDW
jgi:hypothetical protein